MSSPFITSSQRG